MKAETFEERKIRIKAKKKQDRINQYKNLFKKKKKKRKKETCEDSHAQEMIDDYLDRDNAVY